MKKKRIKTKIEIPDAEAQESNEDFYFIAGYTSNGMPFGITWEQAIEEGFTEQKELDEDKTEDISF